MLAHIRSVEFAWTHYASPFPAEGFGTSSGKEEHRQNIDLHFYFYSPLVVGGDFRPPAGS